MDSFGAYKKSGDLGGARHGDAYQVHVLMMLYERALSCNNRTDRRYADFRLATELDAAGKFDDAVLVWKSGDDSRNWLFVQVKHKLVPMQLNEKHLFPDTEDARNKGEFSLYKYLVSFWDIVHRSEFDGGKQFVMFTNCGLARNVEEWFVDGEVEAILKSGVGGERFLKLQATEEQCEQLLHYTNKDLLELTEIVRSTVIDGRNDLSLALVNKYRGALASKVLVVDNKMVKFAPRFIKRNKLDHSERILRNKLFQDDATPEQLMAYGSSNEELQKVLTSKSKSCNTLPLAITHSDVQDFFDSIIFAVKQPDNNGMKSIILNDLRSHQTSPIHGPGSGDHYALLAYGTLQLKIHSCLDSPTGMSLCGEDLQMAYQTVQRTISSSRLSVQTDLFRGEMQNLRMELNNPELHISEHLTALISSTREGLLTCLKIFQIVRETPFRYFSLKDLRHQSIVHELCEALREPNAYHYLLLKDDCSRFEYATEILNAVPPDGAIKLVLITDCKESAARFFGKQQFNLLQDDEFTLGQLTQASQNIVKQNTVLFQGVEVEISELVEDSVLGDVIKSETLQNLIQGKTVSIGPHLPDLGVKYYIPRIIARSDGEESDASDTNHNDTLEDDSNENTCYSESQLLEDLPDILGERRVFVLSSTPGMGKTTLWKKLAILAKSKFPTKWIIFLKLQDFPVHLIASGKFSASGFLGDHFELPQLDRSLLAECLKIVHSVYIFVDGFDELPHMSMGSAIRLIRELQQTVRIFVNTRTRMQLELEQAFKVDVFFLNPISKSEQTDLFRSICDFIEGDHVSTQPLFEFVDRLMDKVHSKSMQIASNFVGVPLMVNMLAEVYKPDIQLYLQTNDAKTLNKIDLNGLNIMELFEKFVYSSFCRQIIDKQKLSFDNRHTKLMLDQHNYTYLGFVKLHNFLGLMSLVTVKKMGLVIGDKLELQILQRQIPLLDSPIVSRAPNFVHGSIAEFFAAKCLFKYFNRMGDERIKTNFMKNIDKRIAPKKHYIKDVFDLYYQVLRDYPTVRKFFFLIVRQQELKLNKLEMLLWCMRPYPLLWACEENFEKLAKHLIKEDPNVVNYTNKYKETALHFAAAQGHAQLCTLLIDNNLDIDAQNVHKQTALHKAAHKGCEDVVNLLIERQANVSLLDNRQQTPLFMAALAGHGNVVQLLIDNQAKLDGLNSRRWSALHIAAIHNHIDVVEILLARRAKTKIGTAKKWIIFLGLLLARGNREIVTLLVMHEVKSLKRNADANQTLFWAVRRNHWVVVQALHKAGASIYEMEDRSGLSTYQLALKHRSFTIAEYILTIQSNVKPIDYALHMAAEAGSVGCILILLQQKAEVNARDANGHSPLELALKSCHVGAVRLLLDMSAKISDAMLFNAIGANQLDSAECVKELLLHGADPSACISGRSALSLAVILDNYECTKLLLQKGASCLVKDNLGRTPFDYITVLYSRNALKAFLEVSNDLKNKNREMVHEIDEKLDELCRTFGSNRNSLNHLLYKLSFSL